MRVTPKISVRPDAMRKRNIALASPVRNWMKRKDMREPSPRLRGEGVTPASILTLKLTHDTSVLSQKLVDKAPGGAGGPTAEHAESQPAPGTRKEPRERGYGLRQRAEATVPRWGPPPRPAPRVNRFLGHHTRRKGVGGGPARGDSNRFA